VCDNAHLLTDSSSDSDDKELLQCIKGMTVTIGQQGAQLADVREELRHEPHTKEYVDHLATPSAEYVTKPKLCSALLHDTWFDNRCDCPSFLPFPSFLALVFKKK
jgi:hypothetical protein